jgi:hypothetical protein
MEKERIDALIKAVSDITKGKAVNNSDSVNAVHAVEPKVDGNLTHLLHKEEHYIQYRIG